MDCGEATQHQIQQCSGLTAQDIDVILLTHLHGDHSFGIFGLLCSIGMLNREHELTVVGPAGINEYVVDTLTKQGGLSALPSEIHRAH
jgi:ribonuclease Z